MSRFYFLHFYFLNNDFPFTTYVIPEIFIFTNHSFNEVLVHFSFVLNMSYRQISHAHNDMSMSQWTAYIVAKHFLRLTRCC